MYDIKKVKKLVKNRTYNTNNIISNNEIVIMINNNN